MLITTVPQGCHVAFHPSHTIDTVKLDELPGAPSIETRISKGFYWGTQYHRRCACKFAVAAKGWFPFPEIEVIGIAETAQDAEDEATLSLDTVSILSAFMELAVYNGETDYTAPMPLWLDILAHYVKGASFDELSSLIRLVSTEPFYQTRRMVWERYPARI